MTEIKSIAGLRREVEKRYELFSDAETDEIAIRAELEIVFELIDSLGAGLRGRLKVFEGALDFVSELEKRHNVKLNFSRQTVNSTIFELRRVLDGGERGEGAE